MDVGVPLHLVDLMIVKDLMRTRPSFLSGMARVLDLGGTLDEYELDLSDVPGTQSDAAAFATDRAALRGDLFRAYSALRQQVATGASIGGEES